MRAYCTISQVADEVCLDLDQTRSRIQRFENWGLRCLQDFELATSRAPISRVFKLSSIGTLNWCDIPGYLDWSKLGTIVGDRFMTFTVNKRIINYHPTICGVEQPNNPYPYYGIDRQDIDVDNIFFNTWVGGLYVGTYYGHSNGGEHNHGQFTVDDQNERFQFSTEWYNKDILIEYIATGIDPHVETKIPERYRSMFIEYIKWQHFLQKKELGMAREHESLFEDEMRKVGRRELNITLEDIVNWNREAHMGVPKT